MEWYIYILRCKDNSLYTGIAKDYKKRYLEHVRGKGAKYTRINKPVKIEKVFACENRSIASKIEIGIKKMKKEKKELLVKGEFKLEFEKINNII